MYCVSSPIRVLAIKSSNHDFSDMTTFLHDVAEYLLNHYSDGFRDCCVVFPNQRSSVYFCNELKKINQKVIWLPAIFTIDEFIRKISGQKLATLIEQLAILYQVHKEAAKSLNPDREDESFDRFFPWAQTILADFNDIDKYLVDAKSLLRNIQEIKKLDSAIDYLTDEQRNAVEEFFYVIGDGKSKLKKKFLDIWQVLLPMYEMFCKRLNDKGLAYEGQVYRRAAETIGSADYELPFKKVFFIGFNAITKSEEKVFSVLKAQGKALFFWDYDQSFIDDKYQMAGFFLRRFVVEFAEPDDFAANHRFDTTNRKITAYASPTVSGQMSVVARQLALTPAAELSDTALVLADENLLMSAIEHVAPYVSDMNVTMGYKLRNSVAGQWIEQLVQLQANKRTVESGTTFYYKNVLALLQHPFLVSASEQFVADLAARIKTEALFQVPMSVFETDEFAKMLFVVIDNPHDFSNYLLGGLKQLMSIWAQLPDDEGNKWVIQQELVYRFILQIQQLDTELANEQLEVDMTTYFKLLRKYVGSLSVPFSGEPIKGLQLMGFLETRNVDFRNLIILSVNEGVLPADTASATFVPFSLRRAFGMPTHDDRESMYAYYFYRLLQRAQNVTLTYFVGKTNGKNGEPSRYIMQLLYDGDRAIQKVLRSDINFASNQPLTIAKDEHTMQLLRNYVVDDRPFDKVKKLSPSAIVAYQKCQLQFYFGRVLGLEPDSETDENIDIRQFGLIFHSAMCKIYSDFLEKKVKVSGNDIRGLKKEFIESKIEEAFVDEIFKSNAALCEKIKSGQRKLIDELNGNNKMVYSVIQKYVNAQCAYDAETADQSPIEFLGLEKEGVMPFQVEVNGERFSIKIGGTIDRIDRTNGSVRVIDYKTGKNEVTCPSVDDVFNPAKIDDYKGILQTLIYCMMVDHEMPSCDVMTPYLFKTTRLGSGDSFKVCSKKDAFSEGNYMRVADMVRDSLGKILGQLFDPEQPFKQTDNEENCKHCNFFYFCNKQSIN